MSSGHADRECPMCETDHLCSVREARRVFRMTDWGATQMLEDADRVCSLCHSVRIEATGEWKRMQTVNSRAWDLSQAGSGKKDVGDYEEILTPDDDGEDRRPSARGRAGAGEADDRESVGGAEW